MSAKFEIKLSENGEYYFILKAGNGEVILLSETYKQKVSAEHGIESVIENSKNIAKFEVKEDENNHSYFILKAKNGQSLAKSHFYETKPGLKSGISAVQKNAQEAIILDSTKTIK